MRRALPISALVAMLLSPLAGCGENKSANSAPPAPPPPAVTVAKPVQRDVTDYDEYVGRFSAVDYIEVRAQVSGYLQSIAFTDGQLVKKGDPLFIIDPRPFQAALDQANGALGQARANLAFADADLKRGESLPRGTVITQQTYDQRVQAKSVAMANVAAQEAAIRQAELNLQFTNLTAPVSGRIGDRRVAAGNLVIGGSSASTTLLATITTVDPIRFDFTMDEASYLRYLHVAGGNGAASAANRGLKLPVQMKLIDEDKFSREGHVDFVDNALDISSGTIRARAVFANPDARLTPGMFGRIRVAGAPPASALLVPDAAIGTEQVRKFVYVLGPDNVVTPKYVTIGAVADGLRVVASGLSPDDLVVTEGLMRIRPGAKVTPQQTDIAKPDKVVRSN